MSFAIPSDERVYIFELLLIITVYIIYHYIEF